MVADNNVGQLIRRYEMNKQEIIDYLKGQTEWSGNHHYILVNKSELISMIEDLDELEFKNYLRDIKSQIDYLRIQGPGKVKSLRMLENMVDNMLTGYWSSTSIRTEKVKVPKCVGELLDYYRNSTDVDLLALLITFKDWYCRKDKAGENENAIDWLVKHPEKFMKAWIDGYEVDEERKYYIRLTIPNSSVIGLYLGFNKDGKFDTSYGKPHITWGWKCRFTEKEIKAIDERYWPFAVPVEKV